MAIIMSDEFLDTLAKSGIIRVEDRIRRIVIDATVKHAIVMYVERFGDERLIEVTPVLTGVEIREASSE